jgi:ferrous iron transport protein B
MHAPRPPARAPRRRIALVGLESAGKSALFRGLTGHATGDEANVRGTTIACRTASLHDLDHDLVDTPGLRSAADTAAARLALDAFDQADTLLLVARGTHAAAEIETLLRELALAGRRSALALTFADKAPPQLAELAAHYRAALGIPVAVVDARRLDAAGRSDLVAALRGALPLNSTPRAAPTPARLRATHEPAATWFDHPRLGPWLALAAVLALFAVPVWLAYAFASWAQPLADAALISPLVERLAFLPPLPAALLTGGYGVLTLGWYSLLWAFPVVLLLGLAVAVGEESGLKDRVTTALDPRLRRIGLAGRDLVPVLTGFGCNVVAVQQTRACSACTRRACVSLIAFGSACSYQIGATLSLFGAGGHGLLFAPYLAALFLVGALHTRLWHRPLSAAAARPFAERAFLQIPSPRAVWWRVRGTLRGFLFQAMPIFLGICLIGAWLAHLGALDALARVASPALALIGLPGETAPGVVFSLIRKDGLLALNADDGALLDTLGVGQIFVLVWLASTLSACLVTLATIARELGLRTAATLAGRQALTALASTLAFASILTLF